MIQCRLFALAAVSVLCVCRVFAATEVESEVSPGPDSVVNHFKLADFLELVAAKTRSNVSQISTWKGTYSFECRRIFDERVKRIIQERFTEVEDDNLRERLRNGLERVGVSRFVLDRNINSIYMTYEPGLSPDAPGGLADTRDIDIVTPEHHLAINPDLTMGELPHYPCTTVSLGLVGYRREVKERYKIVRFGGRLVDPLFFFGTGSLPIWDWCEAVASGFRGGKLTRDQMSRFRLNSRAVDDDIIYDVEVRYKWDASDPEDRKVVTYTFLESAGLNLIKWKKQRGEVVSESREMIFDSKEGIYYPSEVVVRRFDNSGNETFYKRYTIEECMFNHPVDEKTFSWQGIAPQNGTRIVDEIEQVMYVYSDGELIDPEDYTPPLAIEVADAEAESGLMFLWINILVVTFLVCLLAVKRFKSSG